MMDKAKQILKEMFVGLAAWLTAAMVILIIISNHKLAVAAGLLLGGATAAGLMIHMYHHLDIALDMDEKHAQSHIRYAAFRRLFSMALVIAVSMIFYKYFHPIGTIIGIFGMKISAYMQPIVHKAMRRINQS